MRGIYIRKKEGIMVRQVGDEHMLYDTLQRKVHVINSTAFFVWQRCNEDHSVDDMVAEAVAEYDVSENLARADIFECLTSFRELSLLER